MARLTPDELVARVGAKLDSVPTDSTVPSINQIKGWLDEGAIEIARLAPESMLGSLIATHTNTITDSYEPEDYVMRILSVSKFGAVCKVVPNIVTFRLLVGSAGLAFDQKSPLACVSGTAGRIAVKFYPETSGQIIVDYVRKPNSYLDTYDSGSEYYLPQEFEQFLISYAVIQGRIQDEEPGLAQQQAQIWYQDLDAAFKRGVSLGFDGS